MNNDAAEVKQRLNIIDVLGEYIKLEKAGTSWRALCPFHNEKSPSFMVSEERQMWKCFGCQKGGDVFAFVMEIEGLDFRESLKLLAEKAGVKLSGYNPKKVEEKNRTLEILELATKWYEYQLWNGPGKIKILVYLRERGLKDETIKDFRLGYAPKGWRNILIFLGKRGYKTEEIVRTGLLVEKRVAEPVQNYGMDKNLPTDLDVPRFVDSNRFYDRFRERIMFPIADYSGRILGYSARVAPGGDESQAKYVNTSETEVYHKSRILYGIDKAKSEIKQKGYAVLVEGNMDVIASHQAGLRNTVAVSGTALTEDQIGIIKRYAPKIKMFFDMDAAGEAATKKSLKLCFEADLQADVVNLSGGKDAADIARENPKDLTLAVEKSQPAMEYIFSQNFSRYNKNKVEEKKIITKEILDVISGVNNEVEKSFWLKKLSQALDIAESALTDILKKANLRSRINSHQKEAEKENDFSFGREKIDVLLSELIGLSLSNLDIWKGLVAQGDALSLGEKDSLFRKIILFGEKSGFEFEKIFSDAPMEEKARAERLCFEKKYRLGLNNELEEIIIGDPPGELQRIVLEIKKELKKKELEKITTDLKTAEEKKDALSKDFLRGEFKRISQELSKLLA